MQIAEGKPGISCCYHFSRVKIRLRFFKIDNLKIRKLLLMAIFLFFIATHDSMSNDYGSSVRVRLEDHVHVYF